MVTYKEAGVDVDRADSIKRIKAEILKESFNARKNMIGDVLTDFGAPAALLDLSLLKAYRHPLLAVHTDGVGTKLIVAQMLGKYDTIGIDCVASNVNDVICVGAEPLSMLSYEAYQELFEPEIMGDITKGLLEGARQAQISIPGGETAILKDILQTGSFDLAGTVVGVVEKESVIDGSNLEDGDVIIGLESSGVHTNGLTLARRALSERMNDEVQGTNKTCAQLLLEPSRIYVNEIMEMLKNGVAPKYISHITGSGFRKIMRAEKLMRYEIDYLPKPPDIFSEIQKSVSIEEMFRTFNMGIGMCVYLSKDDVDRAMTILEKIDGAHIIGRCFSDNSKSVVIKPHNIVLHG